MEAVRAVSHEQHTGESMDGANEPTGYTWLVTQFLGLSPQYAMVPAILLCGAVLLGILVLSRRIPRFLAGFVHALAIIYAIMAVLQFGAMAGWIGQSLSGYVPSLVMICATVVGAGLICAVSFIPVIQTIMRIGDRFFRSSEPSTLRLGPFGSISAREGVIGSILLIFIILLNMFQVAVTVRFNVWYGDLFNALQAKEVAAFWFQGTVVFVPLATLWVVSQMVEYAASFVLRIRWRSHLNRHYVAGWLGNGNHYEMQLTGSGTDNPDQRIADDLRDFVDQTFSQSIQVLNQGATLVSFVLILWGLSRGFTLPGTGVVIPGLLVWIALAYATIGTVLTHMIGRPLIGLFFQKEKAEADYRFSLARVREYGEQIALLEGEHAEGERLSKRFSAIVANFLAIAVRTVKLESFRLSFRQANVIFPFLLAAPYYFIGQLEFGQIQRIVDAFSSIQAALNFFILAYATLAAYKAVVDRLTTFENALDRVTSEHLHHPRAQRSASKEINIDIENVSVRLPDGQVLIADADLTFRRGEATLVSGPSGSGKSTLFRTIVGIWPFSNGRINIPAGNSVMELPQRPYIPQGSLRDAVTYPGVAGTYTDAQIIEALQAAKLGQFTNDLDDERLWSQTLSLGEQQRLAVARALLTKPDWLLLDEATAALDEQTEDDLYAAIKQRLPQTTVISIGHRSTLKAFHARHVELRKQDGAVTLTDKLVKA